MIRKIFYIFLFLLTSQNIVFAQEANIAPTPENSQTNCSQDSPIRVHRRFDVARAYPSGALSIGQEAIVSLDIFIGENGKVINVEIVENNNPQYFGQTIIDEAKRMTFYLPKNDCHNAPYIFHMTINFSPND